MQIIKEGGHRLFEEDMETERYVAEILIDFKKNGINTIRKYSEKFGYWNQQYFELSQK